MFEACQNLTVVYCTFRKKVESNSQHIVYFDWGNFAQVDAVTDCNTGAPPYVKAKNF